jgi:predicted metal-dependent phosphoesterase TrpH
MFADLHLHSYFSDGTYSPEEVVAHAARFGLAALALTDHDSVEGCARMDAACEAADIEFIPGAEFTAEQGGNELHVLGYFLDTHHANLLDEIASSLSGKTASGRWWRLKGENPACRRGLCACQLPFRPAACGPRSG